MRFPFFFIPTFSVLYLGGMSSSCCPHFTGSKRTACLHAFTSKFNGRKEGIVALSTVSSYAARPVYISTRGSRVRCTRRISLGLTISIRMVTIVELTPWSYLQYVPLTCSQFCRVLRDVNFYAAMSTLLCLEINLLRFLLCSYWLLCK